MRTRYTVAIAPYYWREARKDAPIHLQMRLKQWPDRTQSNSRVTGRIVRIFRDQSGRLKLGDTVSFDIDWRDRTERFDPNAPVVLGRQHFYFEPAWLRAARFMEAYLYWSGDQLHLSWDQATLLMRPTSQPSNPVEGPDYGIQVTDDVIRRAANPPKWWWPF